MPVCLCCVNVALADGRKFRGIGQNAATNTAANAERKEPDKTPLAAYKPTRFWIAGENPSSADSWEQPASQPMAAVILDMDAQYVTVVSEDNPRPRKIPSKSLVAVEVEWPNEDSRKAHQAFLTGDHRTSIRTAQSIIASGTIPRWQQKFLAAEMTESLMALNQTANAARVFLSLAKESPPPLLWASAPVRWLNHPSDPALLTLCRDWLSTNQDPVAQLISGSWLLNESESAAAKSALERLAASNATDPVSQWVRPLAAAQLWRMATPVEVVERHRDWSAERDQLIPSLQFGPTAILADKLERADRKQEALAQWLRVLTWTRRNTRDSIYARHAASEILRSLAMTAKPNYSVQCLEL